MSNASSNGVGGTGSAIGAVMVESTATVSAKEVSMGNEGIESAKQGSSIVHTMPSIVDAFLNLVLFIVFVFNNYRYMGVLIDSTKFCTSFDGGGVNLDTANATAKLISMPSVPIPSGEIPNHQCSAVFNSGSINLK